MIEATSKPEVEDIGAKVDFNVTGTAQSKLKRISLHRRSAGESKTKWEW